MYQELINHVKRAGVLSSIAGVLHWDQQVTMPSQMSTFRGEQMATISALTHKLQTLPRIGELLGAINPKTLTNEQAAQVREIRRQYERAVRVPESLLEELARLSVDAHTAWVNARRDNDFKTFLPFLEKLVVLQCSIAHHINPHGDPYATLVEEFEPDISVSEMQKLFGEVTAAVVPLVAEIKNVPVPDTAVLCSAVPEHIQMQYCRNIAETIGYDFGKGRLDTAVHPFCGGGGRITTRFSSGWWEAISAAIHESGHGMYEHGLPTEHFGTPLGEARSMGVHESQSRLWENHVGKSLEFWGEQYSKLKRAYAPVLDSVGVNEFYKLINVVKPDCIRTEADELTYVMHIALRFEIENALIGGLLRPSEVPDAWNAGMKKLLGVTVPSDTKGCLQDTHWSMGLFGYFPTYTLGSMLAAQLWQAAERATPNLRAEIAKGDCSRLRQWLHENIHSHGCLYKTGELVEHACGEKLNAKAYVAYLNKKFRYLYDV